MRKTKHIIGGIFTFAISLLFFTDCNNPKTEAVASTDSIAAPETITQYLPIAYVNQDSLLTHFNYYNSLMSDLENNINKRRNSVTSDYQKFQKEVMTYQQKRQNNAFLSQERIIQEETRLERMQQDLEKKATQLDQEILLQQRVLEQQLSDSLALGIKEFNSPQKYQMILTKAGNMVVLYADEHYDITNDVIKFLNERFKTKE